MMKYLYNKRGSTLLMVVIMTAMLTVLGVAVLSMTFMNVGMKYNDYYAKNNMYFAESGIDEVYAYLASQVEESTIAARVFTDNYVKALKTYLDNTLDDDDPSNDGLVLTAISFVGETFDSSLYMSCFYIPDNLTGTPTYHNRKYNDDAIEKAANKVFFHKFKEEVRDRAVNWVADIENLSGLDSNVAITVENTIPTIEPYNYSQEKITVGPIKSKFIDNNIPKEIQTNIDIVFPKNGYPLSMDIIIEEVNNNPIWQNALVANKNILMKNNIIIDGNIFSIGKQELGLGGKQKFEGNGIIIEGNVNIKGNLTSATYVQTNAPSAKLHVEDGMIYCNSLATNTIATNSEIILDKADLCTFDDLELNAANSHIKIEGSYYGMSNGEGDLEPNNSSSIIINTELATASSPGASLIVDGTVSKKRYDMGVYIPGTAYIDTPGDSVYFPYQTGESVSIKPNYLVYSQFYKSSNPLSPFYDPIYANTNLGGASVGFAVKDASGVNINIIDKRTYFVDQEILGIFKSGYSNSLQIKGVKHSLGAYLDDSTHTWRESNPYSSYGFRQSIINDFNHLLFNTVLPEGIPIPDASYDVPIENYPSFKTTYNHKFNYTFTHNTNYSILTECLDFSGVPAVYDKPANNNAQYVYDQTKEAMEIVYVTKNDTDVFISGLVPGGQSTNNTADGFTVGKSIVADANNRHGGYSYYQGIIITNGDVLIDGNVKFVGTIIAGGNIIIRNGYAEINNRNTSHQERSRSKVYLAKMISADDTLTKVFGSKSIEVDGSNKLQFNTSAVQDADGNSDAYYRELVKVVDWTIID